MVFHTASDPVANGLVASLARPGGNLTGVSLLLVELYPKRLELLLELVPQAKAIAFFVDSNQPAFARLVQVTQEAARSKGVQLHIVKTGSTSEIDAAFPTLRQLHADAVLITYGGSQAQHVATLAARYSIPAAYGQRAFAEAGGLLSYGSSIPAAYVVKAGYTAKILKGAKPADLPIQQPTTFELVINLKTATALGLIVPQSLLARADEVIE